MINTTKKLLVLLVLAVSFSIVQAQFLWEDDGIPLRQGYHIQWSAESACNSLGETCIVWIDARMGESNIYAQKFDTEGSPMWEEGGVMVGGFALNVYVPPKICASSDDGFLITWGEHFGEDPIKAQKLSPAGEILWDPQGVAACEINGGPFYSEIISGDAGGAYILWRNDSGPQQGINLQKILSDGSLAPGWNVNGLLVTSEGFNDDGNCLCRDGSGGVIVTWVESEGYPERNIYAQRYNADGNELWSPGGEAICTLAGLQDSPAICEDGAGGAFVVWHDYRTPNGSDIYMQRIDGEGNQLWRPDGEILCQEAESQMLPKIIYTNDNCAVIIWEDYRNNLEDYFDIYCQRINGTGQLLWGAGGTAVCIGEYYKITVNLDCDNSGNIFTSWTDMRDGYSLPYIYAQKIDVNGQVEWHNNGVLAASEYSTMPAVNTTVDGGAIMGYLYSYGDSTGIFLQKVDSDGNLQLLPNGRLVFESISGDVDDGFCLTGFSEDCFLAVWEEGREYNTGTKLYFQVFDIDGNFHLVENGLPLCANIPSGYQIEAKSTAPSDGNAIVAWEDSRFGYGNHRVYAQKIDEEGNLLWDVEGVQASSVDQNQEEPYICSDELGGAYIAYNDYSSIYTQRISADGGQPWGNEATYVGGGGVYGVVEDGAGGCIVMWYSPMISDKDIHAARILPSGVVDWSVTVCGAPDDQWKASIIPSIQTGAVIAWQDDRNGASDIYAARIDTNGNMPWELNGVPVCTFESNQLYPRLIEDDEGCVICAWVDQRGSAYDTYCQRISPDGEMMFQRDGIVVAEGPGDQDNFDMVPDGESGVLFIWQDQQIGSDVDLQAIHLNSEGNITNPVWNPGGNPVCDAYGGQYSVQLAGDGSGGAIAVWQDMRSSTYVWENNGYTDLYMQRINDNFVSVEIPGEPDTPLSYYLGQPYPNPFNQTTVISYKLQADSYVELKVYNVMGREVHMAVSSWQLAGEHSVVWDASEQASGVYFVRLSVVGGQSSVRKMLLVK